MSSAIELIAFDYDDTLMMTRQCKMRALRALGERLYGIKVDEDRLEKYWGIAHHDLFANIFGLSGRKLDEALAYYEEIDKEFPIVPHDDALATLLILSEAYPLVIVSSCTKKLISMQLANSSLSAINFDFIFGAEDTTFHKPSGRVFDAMFQRYNKIDRQGFLYIGDGYKDFLAAQDAQIQFIGIDRLETETETEKFKGQDVQIVKSLNHIKVP